MRFLLLGIDEDDVLDYIKRRYPDGYYRTRWGEVADKRARNHLTLTWPNGGLVRVRDQQFDRLLVTAKAWVECPAAVALCRTRIKIPAVST